MYLSLVNVGKDFSSGGTSDQYLGSPKTLEDIFKKVFLNVTFSFVLVGGIEEKLVNVKMSSGEIRSGKQK